MGCCFSRDIIDFDTIQPIVLRIKGGLATYSGTTERGRFQVNSLFSLIDFYKRISSRH